MNHKLYVKWQADADAIQRWKDRNAMTNAEVIEELYIVEQKQD